MWEYVKGSEADFEGAPEWAVYLAENKRAIVGHVKAWEGKDKNTYCYVPGFAGTDEPLKVFTDGGFINDPVWSHKPVIIAERRKVDDLQSRTNDANLQQAFDTVQRPAHYNQSGIECIDAIAASMSTEEFRGFLKGNVQKYVWRSEHKGGAEDYRKARYYLDRLVKELSK